MGTSPSPPPAPTNPKRSVLSVLAVPDFRRLWVADVVSDAGSFITFIALAVYVHELTGTAIAVGFALALRAIPWFTIGPIAGTIADRMDRRVIMVTCDLARAGLVLALPFTDTAGQAYAIAFASGIFGPIFRPARQALIPSVVSREEYVRALALGEVSHQVLHTIGPALGGATVLAVGARNAFFIDAVTFIFSAVLVLRIGVRGAVRGRPAGLGDVGRDLVEGARILWRDKILRSLVPARALMLLGFEGAVAALVVYVSDDLGRGAGTYGIVLGASGLGTAIVTVLLARRGTAASRTVPLLFSAAGPAALVLVALRPGLPGLLAVMFAVGAAAAGTALYVNTTLAERTPDEARGRVFGLSAAVIEVGDVSGTLMVAALADAMGASGGIALGGIIGAGIGFAVLVPAIPGLRRFDAERAAAADTPRA